MKASIVLVGLLAAGLVSALDFEMQQQTKCIFEELNANVIVVGDYKAANKDNPSLPIYVNVKVRLVALQRSWRCCRRYMTCWLSACSMQPEVGLANRVQLLR